MVLYVFTSYRFPWMFKKVMVNSRNLTLRGHETYNDISNKIKRPYLTDLKSKILLSPRTDKLLVASDDPRMFLAAHVYGPASL